jgi:hypothetical protein
VADEVRARTPDAKLARRRLHGEHQRVAVLEVEHHLVRDARRGARHGPADARLVHLGMAADDLDELAAAGEAVAIHVRDPRLERRTMHEDDGRPIGRLGQARREPAQTLLAEQPPDLPGTSVSSAMSLTG